MRDIAVALLMGLILVGAATADEEPQEQPPKPLTPEQAADRVMEAFQAKDEAALEALAEKDDPDPWLVVDALLLRGGGDAAAAFAGAAPRPDTSELPAYVLARRSVPGDGALRARIVDLARVHAGGDVDAMRALASSIELPPRASVTGVRLAHGKGSVLAALGEASDAVTALHAAAEMAERLGWLARAQTVYEQAGKTAYDAEAFEDARASWTRGLAVSKRRGDRRGTLGFAVDLASVDYVLGKVEAAMARWERGAAEAVELEDPAMAVVLLRNLAQSHGARGQIPLCIERLRAMSALQESMGDPAAAAATLDSVADTHYFAGAYERAIAVWRESIRRKEALGDARGVARVLRGIGMAQMKLNPTEALTTLRQAHEKQVALGDTQRALRTAGQIGVVQHQLGVYGRALGTLRQVLERQEALGDEQEAVRTLGNIANVHRDMGRLAEALSLNERVLARYEALDDRVGVATTLHNVGNVYRDIGLLDRALKAYERALAMRRAMGSRGPAARTLGSIGVVHWRRGAIDEAFAAHEEALAELEALGDRMGAGVELASLATLHLTVGRPEKALPLYERVIAMREQAGDRLGAALTNANAALAHQRLGDLEGARRTLERVVRELRRLRASRVLPRALSNLASVHLAEGDSARALLRAEQALAQAEHFLGGWDEEGGAAARQIHAGLFANGALAAAREEDPAGALQFLESGRAGALLDALGKREVLRWKTESLPPELLAADREAQGAERVARQAYEQAHKQGNRSEVRQAAKALDDAIDCVREMAGRIQREMKAQAALFYPRAETIETIQLALEEDQALVLYGLCLDEALALVLRQDDERIVHLGTVKEVEAACKGLDASGPDASPAAALARLRTMLVEPLKLEADVKQVLVSPEGPLCYLPFGALCDHVVTMTPSGTTHVLLLDEERAPGTGILALGDPDYAGASEAARAIYWRGRRLSSLQATRPEVETVGTTKLLGAKASEAGFREALPERKRWKAVHLACHGLIDVERPMLSSLALTRAGEDDGFLTALEVLRMEVPADLAVLSACETAQGKIVKGEGIVGLTRAFMYAGAPRVICSLWKVDDEATRALMVKFYELWNPDEGEGLGAAAALKKAQEYVRDHPDHPEWKHPYYWAAWVLWGLPN